MTSSLIMMFLEYSFNGPSKHLSEALIEGVWMTQTKCAWWRNLISFGSIFKAINLLSWNWLQNEHCAFCRTLIIVCQKAITFEMWFPITFATKIANFYFFFAGPTRSPRRSPCCQKAEYRSKLAYQAVVRLQRFQVSKNGCKIGRYFCF